VTVDCDLGKVPPNQRRFRVRVRVGVGVGINGGVATVGFSVGGSIKMALGLRLQSGLVLGSGLVIRIGTIWLEFEQGSGLGSSMMLMRHGQGQHFDKYKGLRSGYGPGHSS